MKEIIVLLLTFAILAVQYHLGLMRKPGFQPCAIFAKGPP